MEYQLIQLLVECIAVGVITVMGWIFKDVRNEMKEMKNSVMDLNIKIAEILVKTESHHERLERLETYRRRIDSGS